LHKPPKIIVITGAESTGKSTLTESLASHFRVPFVPEIAREYIENIGRKYTYRDIEIIAKKQVTSLKSVSGSGAPFVFADTWLIITKIWFEVVFGKVPQWIENEILNTSIDLFLVCDTDLPWIPDPVRENGGENRLILQNRYIEQIKKYNFNYNIVSGIHKKRLENAIAHINFNL
jgi:nicotinamide riboside kinase